MFTEILEVRVLGSVMGENPEVRRLETALEDFKTTSREIEQELESQLAECEEQKEAMRAELAETGPTIKKLREHIQKLELSLQEDKKNYTIQITDLRENMRMLEQENESLERQARIAQSSVATLEQSNASLLERLAFAEIETPEVSPSPIPSSPTTPQPLPRRRNREPGETPHGKRVHSN